MGDDIVTRLRGRYCSHGNNYDGAWQPIEWPSTCERCELDKRAADEIDLLRADRECLTAAYWNIRKAIECAEGVLPSPHPLWSELNELMETLGWMENLLDIPNRWEFIGSRGNTKLVHKLKVIIHFVKSCITMNDNRHVSSITMQGTHGNRRW